MLTDSSQNEFGNFENWESSKSSIRNELDQARQNLNEVMRKIEHSQGEVNRLTQRNATITASLQQIRTQFENTLAR